MPFTDAQISAAKQKAEEVYLLTAPESGVDVIIRPPSPAEYNRFTLMWSDPDPLKRSGAPRQLLIDCLVAPEVPEFMRSAERYPGLVHQFAMEIRKIAGSAEEVTRTKL